MRDTPKTRHPQFTYRSVAGHEPRPKADLTPFASQTTTTTTNPQPISGQASQAKQRSGDSSSENDKSKGSPPPSKHHPNQNPSRPGNAQSQVPGVSKDSGSDQRSKQGSSRDRQDSEKPS